MSKLNLSEEPSPKKFKKNDNPSPVKAEFQASLSASAEFSGLKKISELTNDCAR